MKSAILLAAAIAAASSAAQADPAQIPDFEPGDSWTFSLTDQWKHQVISSFTVAVKQIEGETVRLEGTDGAGAPYFQTLTAEGNMVALNGREYMPHMHHLAFPLSVGKQWKGEYGWKRDDGAAGTIKAEYAVTALETVEVPAGKFDAYRIEAQGWWSRENRSGKITETYWYAPATKRIVRLDYQDFRPSGGAYNRVRLNLEGMALAR